MRKNSSRKIKRTAAFFSILIPCFCVSVYLFKDCFFSLLSLMPRCLFNSVTGYLCPACGNTRCLMSLLHGDLIAAAGYNVAPILLLIIGVMLYAELVSTAFGHHLKILPRNYKIWMILLFTAVVYFITRNVLPWVSFSIKNY